jgi:hypothetical protein
VWQIIQNDIWFVSYCLTCLSLWKSGEAMWRQLEISLTPRFSCKTLFVTADSEQSTVKRNVFISVQCEELCSSMFISAIYEYEVQWVCRCTSHLPTQNTVSNDITRNLFCLLSFSQSVLILSYNLLCLPFEGFPWGLLNKIVCSFLATLSWPHGQLILVLQISLC